MVDEVESPRRPLVGPRPAPAASGAAPQRLSRTLRPTRPLFGARRGAAAGLNVLPSAAAPLVRWNATGRPIPREPARAAAVRPRPVCTFSPRSSARPRCPADGARVQQRRGDTHPRHQQPRSSFRTGSAPPCPRTGRGPGPPSAPRRLDRLGREVQSGGSPPVGGAGIATMASSVVDVHGHRLPAPACATEPLPTSRV